MKRKTILLVDDDSAHRLMLKANLKSEFEIIEAGDGDEVLPILAQTSVDLLILDLKMRRLSGIETLTALKEADGINRLLGIFCFYFFQDIIYINFWC